MGVSETLRRRASSGGSAGSVHPVGEYEVIDDGDVRWRFDAEFLRSRWTCIWGLGCPGILDEPAAELQQGCCSVGARMVDDDEQRRIVGLAAMVEPSLFQFHEQARIHGVLTEDGSGTRLVEGACIFLNRPGFEGGGGCALHLSALADEESPIDWKPSVCWQLPLRVEWSEEDGTDVATVRRWGRADWGDDPMHWWCTEDEGAFVGDRPVVESLADELGALVGTEVAVELRRRLAGDDVGGEAGPVASGEMRRARSEGDDSSPTMSR